ncbi:MAG: TraR/DksA family transcriptional regulator [Myxococcota bacterium]
MEELTEEQRRDLQADLQVLCEALEQTLGLAREGAKPVSLDNPIGRVSRVDALQQQAMAQANRRSLELRLAQVRSALSALESGEYGYCRRCEEPIAYRRLKSRPETPFCVDCQRGRETRA